MLVILMHRPRCHYMNAFEGDLGTSVRFPTKTTCVLLYHVVRVFWDAIYFHALYPCKIKKFSRFAGLHYGFSTFTAVFLCDVSGLAETVQPLSVSGRFLLDVPAFLVPSDSTLPLQLLPSSRALPRHLHFCNCSDVFRFMSSFDVPEPFHPSTSLDHRHRFHPGFPQYLLISPVFQQVHPPLPIAPFSSLLLPYAFHL